MSTPLPPHEVGFIPKTEMVVSRWRLPCLDVSIPGVAASQVYNSGNSRALGKARQDFGVSQSCCEQVSIAYLRRVILGPCLAYRVRAHVVLQWRRRRLDSGETEFLRVLAVSQVRTVQPLDPILVRPGLSIARETIGSRGFASRIRKLASNTQVLSRGTRSVAA